MKNNIKSMILFVILLIIIIVCYKIYKNYSKQSEKVKKEYYNKFVIQAGGNPGFISRDSFDIAPPSTSAWLSYFLLTNPGAQKLKDKMFIRDNNLYIKTTTGEDSKIAYTDDQHIGFMQMTDGKWIPIGDVFTLISGPSEEFRYFYFEYNSNTNIEEFIWNPFSKDSWEDLGRQIQNTATQGIDWVKDRSQDVASFAQNAANSVSTWATKASADTLNWAKGAGNLIAKNLISIGNKIDSESRQIANTIKDTSVNTVNSAIDFFKNIGQKAREAFESAFRWIKNNANLFKEKVTPILGTIINIALQGTMCEYKVQRELGIIPAVKAIEPALIPPLRQIFLEMIKKGIGAASGGVLVPFVEILFPIIQEFSDVDDKIDELLGTVIEMDELALVVTTVSDPVVKQFGGSACKYLEKPDVSSLTLNTPDDIDDIQIEDFRYQFSALSATQKATRIALKIKQGIEYYNKVKPYIPIIKNTIQSLTLPDELNQKICEWSTTNKVIPGIIAILQKAISSPKINTKVKDKIQKLIRVLLKLQTFVAFSVAIKDLLILIPNLPTDVEKGIDLFTNLDKNMLQLLK